ncbi:MAG: DMT family transporter [Phycisphaerales bacterium]
MSSLPDSVIGATAGVTTSLLWVATSMFFTAAGKRIGATVVNTIRIFIAVGLLAITHRFLFDAWYPELRSRELVFLALSGVIGLSIGDQALFVSFVYIGPRLATLVMVTSPLWAALFAWFALGETLTPIAMLGVGLTIFGVAWVVLERPARKPGSSITDAERHAARFYTRGIVLATVGAICQAGGLLLSKQGMGHGSENEAVRIAPQAATLVRMSFAAIGVLPIWFVNHFWLYRSRDADERPRGRWTSGMGFVLAGAVAGPYLGVWLSLVAADNAPVGVAQTLISLTPVFILPFAAWISKERITPRAIAGAVIAVLGAALLFVPVADDTTDIPQPPGVQDGGTDSGM